MTDDDEMTVTPEEREQIELSFCPFELIPGPNGTTFMFWEEEDHVVATFPSMEVAKAFIIGSDFPRRPGWDRSDVGVDVKRALKRYREEHGAFPTFKFDASHTVFDLYEPLELATEFVARLIYHEVGAVSEWPDRSDAYTWCAMVSRLLNIEEGIEERMEKAIKEGSGFDLDGCVSWKVTQLLFNMTWAIQELEQQGKVGSGRRTCACWRITTAFKLNQVEPGANAGLTNNSSPPQRRNEHG